MRFTTEFKQKAYNILQFNPYLTYCMEALEENDPMKLRIYLDMALDEVEKGLKYRPLEDEGDRLLWNGIVTQYKAIESLYNEFMDKYTAELDAAEKVRQNG